MDYQQYYHQEVFPLLPQEQIFHFAQTYPSVYFSGHDSQSLATLPIVMLVALTGTGKSTTIQHLADDRRLQSLQINTIPTRRDLANMVTIPLAQRISDEAILPVSNRVERFRYTNTFAQHVTGGFAQAFTWLQWRGDMPQAIISEGVRGHTEIAYALEHTNWHIVELTASPLTRLRRLSSRDDAFDKASGSDSLSFLPQALHGQVQADLTAGDISTKAMSIMQAEAQNYGLEPYSQPHSRYTQISTDDTPPDSIAAQVAEVVLGVI